MSALPGFLTRNWVLKVSAFAIALLLWVSVRVEAPTRQTVSGIPVRVALADPDWALAEDPSPANVVVRFGGLSRDMFSMAMNRPTVVIPLDQVNSADTSVVLLNQWVRVPDRPNVVVEDIQPSTVQLRLEPIQRIELPVAVRFAGELDGGLAMAGPPQVSPVAVRLSGPASRVSERDSLRLQAVDLSDVAGTGGIQVAVDTAGLQGLQVQPSRVELILEVEERVERLVDEVEVVLEVDDWTERFEVVPAGVPVLLSGAQRLLDEVETQDLRLVVEVDEGDLPVDPGEEIQVTSASLRLEGVPPYLEGEIEVDGVTVVRLLEVDEDPPGPEAPLQGGAGAP